MKKLSLILFSILFITICNAQFKGVGDTTEVELITFESESIYFNQATPTDNI